MTGGESSTNSPEDRSGSARPSVCYPSNWDDIRERVKERHMNRCGNCGRMVEPLHVHHIVPVAYAGSHRLSNLKPLCSLCHAAAHGRRMAPRTRWFTNGEMSSREFEQHKLLWQRLRDRFGVPRYDPSNECVYIPIADVEFMLDSMKADMEVPTARRR